MTTRLRRLLVIEDNPGDARLIREMIREATNGNDVDVICSYELDEGLDVLQEQGVDVALLDLGMPGSNGLNTFTTVHKHSPNTPIIVLTGNNDDELAAQALRDGAQDYLVKGQIDADLLYRSIRYAMQRKRAEEQLRAVNDVQRLLLSELDHRVRNNLTSLVSLIDLSHRSYTDVDRFAESMRSRIQTMVTVHTLLSRSHWSSIELRKLLHSLLPGDLIPRVTLEGPDVVVPVRQLTALGMVLNEFLSNCMKYGALSNHQGQLHMSWSVQPTRDHSSGSTDLIIDWIESGGPPIESPPETGVGTSLVTGLVKSELSGAVELGFEREGVRHRLIVRLDDEIEPAHQSDPPPLKN